MSDLASDITALAELQARLFVADAKESAERLMVPVVLAAVGGAILLGSVPVLLLFISALLMLAGLGVALSLFLAFLVGAILGAIALLIAWYLLRDSLISFRRSREELVQNVRWIKDALRQSGRNAQAAECT